MGPSHKSSLGSILGIIFAVVLFGAFFFVPVTDPEPENTNPVIDSVVSSHDKLYGLQTCVLYCTAHDDDGDSLAYTWSSTGGTLVADGEMAKWTAPRRQGSYGIMVEVSDDAGDRDSSVSLVTVARNQSPVINAVSCERPFLLQGQKTKVTCDAFDSDGHAITFEWSCTTGSISGSDAAIEWTAPSASGTYLISTTVSDEMGATCTSSTLIMVAPTEPPTIDTMIIRPFLPEYSKELDWGYRLLKGSECECEIECVTSSANDELNYTWSCEDGSIEGSGRKVLFTPPDRQAEIHVT
ncbi:MAG: hypothetical protein KAQ74_05800, partial [Dehalococcoidia bacterium]|nr:hypothetical protein [Dehalococcoidia bacterium]